ncbi:hypothetical protein ACFWOJ_38835 [Streptomyces sp. NPDC058439]|uniref:hypothetical protein n=1 Tax=Streptomyces sp. NPDC058439 TaxID=3346500 RepID=UPI00365D3B94
MNRTVQHLRRELADVGVGAFQERQVPVVLGQPHGGPGVRGPQPGHADLPAQQRPHRLVRDTGIGQHRQDLVQQREPVLG